MLFAYEPIWSIGTGGIPKNVDLEKNIIFIKNKLRNNFKLKTAKVLYGGSVNPKNITILKKINTIDGFLIAGASQDSKKFIDIVKKPLFNPHGKYFISSKCYTCDNFSSSDFNAKIRRWSPRHWNISR